MHLRVKCVDENVRRFYGEERRGLPGDAGFDLHCPDEVTIQPGETKWVDLKIQVSAHTCATSEASVPYFLMPRSSISKTPLRLANSVGLIDAGYRGNLIGVFDNIKQEPYTIKAGDRLLQAVAFDGSYITHEVVDQLSETVRGAGGFGSTGKN